MTDARDIWEEYARSDPFWSIAGFDKYRVGQMDDNARDEFFRSGREHVEEMWQVFESRIGRGFCPSTSIDYGCGVGRILFPLAERSANAVGVDISQGMLDGVRANSPSGLRDKIRLQTSDEFLTAGADRYDLVHSYIVMQHIESRTGYEIIRRLVERLNERGLGMLHVTYQATAGALRRVASRVYRDVPAAYRLRTIFDREAGPYIPMYEYNLKTVEYILSENACEIFARRETDHGHLGTMFFFQKQ
jgi:2-polyprenyl-3-methyl-5-hydroxy-6-metoxy-1,4-benzoquinol methylase